MIDGCLKEDLCAYLVCGGMYGTLCINALFSVKSSQIHLQELDNYR